MLASEYIAAACRQPRLVVLYWSRQVALHVPSVVVELIVERAKAIDDAWGCMSRSLSSTDEQHRVLVAHKKAPSCAMGRVGVSHGVAEWKLKIVFESFGGITMGVYRDHSRAEPVDATPFKGKYGYGYQNKNGYIFHNGVRKKYGRRFRREDILTITLNMLNRTLSFAVNDQDIGVAFDSLPAGTYRVAVTMRFREQKVEMISFRHSPT